MSPCRTIRPCILVAVLLLICGCGGGGGGGGKTTVTDAVGKLVSRYLVVDLNTGKVTPRRTIPDLATNPAYRSSLMVFRLLDAGSTTLGSPGSDAWGQSDETRKSQGVGSFHCAVFETTQAQWQLLARPVSQPWQAVTLASLTGPSTGDSLPAYGMTFDSVNLALSAASARLKCSLSLPSEQQWEYACRAGTTGRFSWGEAHDDLTIQTHAVLQQPFGSARGPEAVGMRQPNAFGLFDMHGNVWEWTRDGWLRGGSWNDGLAMCRSANRIFVDPQTPHGLAGVRLVYRQRQ